MTDDEYENMTDLMRLRMAVRAQTDLTDGMFFLEDLIEEGEDLDQDLSREEVLRKAVVELEEAEDSIQEILEDIKEEIE